MKAQQIVDLLNDAAMKDPGALHALCANRVPCNQLLADHPTIQVDGTQKSHAVVGMLGILNGIAALDGELIEMMFSDDEKLPQFMGFRLRPKEKA